jgi:nucleoside triphosphate diphosphatase
MAAAPDLLRLLDIMARLRDPERGCPWDRAQSFATIAPYTIEEAYEVAEACEQGDMAALKDELGDLLFQVVFHARMAEEAGLFAFNDVARAIADKMLRRHPHVFADAVIADAAAQTVAWEEHKAAERRAKAAADGGAPASALDGVDAALPALTRALKLQARAARVGFDWPTPPPILDKIEEEIGELREAMDQGAAPAAIEDEVGDLLFAVVNLARRLAIDPEQALRGACRKFDRRFRRVEALLAEAGSAPDSASLDEMEAQWKRAKAEERSRSGDSNG